MNDREIKNETLKQYEELLLDVDMLYCKLARYKDKMTETAFKFGAGQREGLFRAEFERTFAPYRIERAQEKYEHKKRRIKFVPRETWLLHRKNLPAKYFIDGVTEDAGDFFAAFNAKLAERKRNRPVRRFFRRLFKRGKPAPATLPQTGVKNRGEVAAVHESLPITTLQACDELVNYAQMEAGLRPPKGFAEWYRKLAEAHRVPATYDLQQASEATKEFHKAARELTPAYQIAELAPNAPQPPQNPPKQGVREDDRVSDETHETPKTGKEKKA